MHVERLQGIWNSEQGLKKIQETAAMLAFANNAKTNARTNSRQSTFRSPSRAAEDQPEKPADRPSAGRDQAQAQRNESFKEKTIQQTPPPVEIKTKNGKKQIVPLTNAERKVFTRKLNMEKIRRDNFEFAKQLAEVKNINTRSIVENAVKSHQKLQKSVIDKSSPKICRLRL